MSDSAKPFHCHRCNVLYTPAADQWIFHELCDECFTEFDQQKVRGRFGGHPEMFRAAPQEVLTAMGIANPDAELSERPAMYYESSKDWITSVGKKLRS